MRGKGVCEFCSRFSVVLPKKNGFCTLFFSLYRFPLARLAPKETGFISDRSPPADPTVEPRARTLEPKETLAAHDRSTYTDFDALVAAELHGEGLGFGALMALASATYFAWWVPFTLWMLAHGRFQSPERTGRDTIYLR